MPQPLTVNADSNNNDTMITFAKAFIKPPRFLSWTVNDWKGLQNKEK